MKQSSLFDVISPIMIGPSSSHTAGALRLGFFAKNIYAKEIRKVEFILYNSFAHTGKGHGTEKALLAGVLGYNVSSREIKNIFEISHDIEYSYGYADDISRHPNSVDIKINDEMNISGNSIGAGEIRIISVNDFSVKISGKYHTLLINYKDKPGMISTVSNIIQEKNINIASLNCDRNNKGGVASMCIALDAPVDDDVVVLISNQPDVYYATQIRKLAI